MGARLLRRRLLAPLKDVAAIRRRHDGVEALLVEPDLRRALRDAMAGVSDVERLATRVELGIAHPRDLGAVRDSLIAAHAIADLLREHAERSTDDTLTRLVPDERADDVLGMLETALVADPPTSHTAGGVIAEGVDPDLDELRTLSSSSKDILLQLEAGSASAPASAR